MATTELDEQIRIYRANRYKARGGALELWTCRDGEVLMSGPAGTGKSRAVLEKLHACCLRWPGTRGLMVRKTRESLTESALVTFETKVVPKGHAILEGTQRRMRQAYHYTNGSEIVVGGMDKPSKVMSTEYDIIYIQEAIELTEYDWESLSSRLRNAVMPFQQLIGDTNPQAPTHWLKRRCDRGQTHYIESYHEDNPTIWDMTRGAYTDNGANYIAKLDALSDPLYSRLRKGRWVASEGIVYETWNSGGKHWIDQRPIPPHWRIIRSIDFGYNNPFICQWWGIDEDDRMYLFKEIYMSHATVTTHSRRIIELSQGMEIEATVADHDAEDRATLAENGIKTKPAYKDKKRGIQAVVERLAIQGDGKPRLFVMRDTVDRRDVRMDDMKKPISTKEEFDSYVWHRAQDGSVTKEDPVDKDNHGMDAMRYAVAYVDELAGSRKGSWGPQLVRR